MSRQIDMIIILIFSRILATDQAVWNRTRPDLISARKMSHEHNDKDRSDYGDSHLSCE